MRQQYPGTGRSEAGAVWVLIRVKSDPEAGETATTPEANTTGKTRRMAYMTIPPLSIGEAKGPSIKQRVTYAP